MRVFVAVHARAHQPCESSSVSVHTNRAKGRACVGVGMSVSVRTHRVKVLGCIHSPEQHAHMALEHDSVRAVNNLQYAGNTILLLPVCVQ